MSFSSNDTMRPLALQRSQSLPQLNSREDSGVGLSGTGSCSGINNIGYESSAGSGGHHHRHHRHHHHRHYRNEVKIPYGTRLVADLRQLMTLRQHYYLEGGWGWLLTMPVPEEDVEKKAPANRLISHPFMLSIHS
ncbi:conserved hypothetical protein [Culex quinquefasciatus]|uniref:Uncharacterized protein n=1 Tax=Culex quinquefasciatus TaxID=7176 RepID=B0WHW1_CULQU|nr:conserved hypothetical protein [Culex quinquefasciatus]|eukprot:XP_001848295.1 conserved hypothetical protein [Culex quinquefasciatus]